MKRYLQCAFAALAVLGPAAGSGLHAQERQILSPRDSVFLSLDTNVVSVNYGRPSIRKRVIMGDLVPWDKVWRTGANQATHLRTNFDMKFGDAPILKGRYTLWTIPRPDRWTIIVNKQTGQWGTAYDERQDLARFDAVPEALSSVVDTFTIAMRQTGPASGVMTLAWEHTQVSIPIQKDGQLRPLSPTDSSAISLGNARVKIVYSRPFARGRTIWGVVVPYDSLWRTGANAATLLTTTASIRIGGTAVPAGSYTLYSIPREDQLTLIVSKKPAGPAQYDTGKDLARIRMKGESVTQPIDPFRIWFESGGNGEGTLHLGWASRAYSIDVRQR